MICNVNQMNCHLYYLIYIKYYRFYRNEKKKKYSVATLKKKIGSPLNKDFTFLIKIERKISL